MTAPYWTNGSSTLYQADARQVPIADKSVHMVVTSPPYWGLRDYEIDGIGLEESLDAWVYSIVEVFREMWRVLRDDGTAWLNLGDAYVGSGKGLYSDGRHSEGGMQATNRGSLNMIRSKRVERGEGSGRWGMGNRTVDGLRRRNQMLQPHRVALALQQPWLCCQSCEGTHHQSAWGRWPDGLLICPECHESDARVAMPGWILRQTVIWDKKNPMPSSAHDRPTTATEYIFELGKHETYYYDRDAIREPVSIYRPARPRQRAADGTMGKITEAERSEVEANLQTHPLSLIHI